MAVQTSPPLPQRKNDWPAYWLVALERAVSNGDHVAAGDAQLQLRRLGIEASIRVIPRREPQREAAHVG